MIRSSLAVVMSGVLSFCLMTCNQRHSNGEETKPPFKIILQPWGNAGMSAYQGDTIVLKVVALRSSEEEIRDANDLQAAAGEMVHWEIMGQVPGEPKLTSPTSATNESGIAETNLYVGREPNPNLSIRVTSIQDASLTLSVSVRTEMRALEKMVPHVINSVVNHHERIRVRLLRELSDGKSSPIADETVHVELVGGVRTNGARLVDEPGDIVITRTNASGVASIRFQTGSTPQLSGYQIIFCGRGSCPLVESLHFTVIVAERGGIDSDCQYVTDCDEGFICDLGKCKPAASYCDKDSDCPAGFVCGNNRLCERQASCISCDNNSDCAPRERCSPNRRCIAEDGCSYNYLDSCPTNEICCPKDWICHECGACLAPDNPGSVIDVRGLWYTKYHYDISDTLPEIVNEEMAPIIDLLNLAFHAQIEVDVPLVGDILEDLLDQLIEEYVPAWVGTIVTILADFVHLFENMETSGELFLVQTPVGPPLGIDISGEENWTNAQFFVPSFCPGGPKEFAENPNCGAIDVLMDPTMPVGYSNDDFVVGVDIDPFIGTVRGEELFLYGRDVAFSLAQVINVLLDVIVQIASNNTYGDFESFLIDIVPCYDFQLAVDDLLCDITDGDICNVPGIEALCEVAIKAATISLGQILGSVELQVLELEFDARARVHAVSGTAQRLGNPNNPTDIIESAIIGGSESLFLGGELDDKSWWYGQRDTH